MSQENEGPAVLPRRDVDTVRFVVYGGGDAENFAGATQPQRRMTVDPNERPGVQKPPVDPKPREVKPVGLFLTGGFAGM